MLDSQFRGTTQQFVLHFNEQFRRLDDLTDISERMKESNKMTLLHMLSKIFPNSVLWKLFMNIPLPPVEMDHSYTSTIHLTIISLSMLVSGMISPKHLHPLRGEMFMQLLVPRISSLLKSPTTRISLRILTPHQMTSIRYIRPNIAETPHNFIWFPER